MRRYYGRYSRVEVKISVRLAGRNVSIFSRLVPDSDPRTIDFSQWIDKRLLQSVLVGRDEEKAAVHANAKADTKEHEVHERRSTPEVRRYRRIIVICTRSRCTPAQSPPFVPLFNIIRNDPQSLEAGRYIGQNHLHVRSRVPNACQQRAPACLPIVRIHLRCRTRSSRVDSPLRFARYAALLQTPTSSRSSGVAHAGHEVDQSHGQPGFSPGAAHFRLCDTLP